MNLTNTIAFHQNDIVWARVKGFYWWPGFVHRVKRANKIKRFSYVIRFFGKDQ